jgi:hypothetical protein
MSVGAACFHSDVTMPAGPADTSEGEIRVTKNYVMWEIESKTSAFISC